MQWDKVLTEISAKYFDYVDIFFLNLAMELSKNTRINKHVIKLINEKQPSYEPIYALNPVELEILKAYIKIYLKIEFIWPFKFFVNAPIQFDKKPNNSVRLCVNYCSLNNLTIKNWYLLPLIGKSLDWLS